MNTVKPDENGLEMQRIPGRQFVELSGQLSNPSPPLLAMLAGVFSPANDAICRPDRSNRRTRRLTFVEQHEIVDRYQRGLMQYEIALEFGINRRTVSQILGRQGARRQRGLSDNQIDQAVVLYADGQSLASIGVNLGVDPGTVRAGLIERGLQMRDSHGRPRD